MGDERLSRQLLTHKEVKYQRDSSKQKVNLVSRK